VDVDSSEHLFSLQGTGALNENHVFGLSRLSPAAAAGLERPTLGFFRTWTSQLRAVEAANPYSVSCAPYVAFTRLREQIFPIESAKDLVYAFVKWFPRFWIRWKWDSEDFH
jgi:hypothetical protein